MASTNIAPVLFSNNSVALRRNIRVISGRTITVIELYNTYNDSRQETTFRIPDYFGRGANSGKSMNVFVVAVGSTTNVSVIYPFPPPTAIGDEGIQNVTPIRDITLLGLVANTVTLVSNPLYAKVGRLMTIQWRNVGLGTNVKFGEIIMGVNSLEFLDIFNYIPTCPLLLSTNESYNNTGPSSCILQLNRLFTVNQQLGIIRVEAKQLLLNASYTITSSNTFIIANSSGTISSGASITIYVTVLTSTTTITPVTLTMTMPGIGLGSSQEILILPGSL